MTLLRPVLLLGILASLLLAAPASANYRVGIAEQNPAMFASPAFQALKLKRTRLLVPWDWYKIGYQRTETTDYMNAARASGFEVLVTFTARRGCWSGSRYSRSSACKAPSTTAYKTSVRQFRAAFPYQRLFATWNEGNHPSQPTYKAPKTAAAYYRTLKSVCRGCQIMAADVLDTSNAASWLRTFQRYDKATPKLWGLHNYQDVNRRRTTGTRRVLAAVPGEVWLTETGGIVSFGRSFPYSESRAQARTKTMFSLADTYDARQRGMRSRVTRLYIYSWFGSPRGARFDSGLVNPDGSVRRAYATVKSISARRWK